MTYKNEFVCIACPVGCALTATKKERNNIMPHYILLDHINYIIERANEAKREKNKDVKFGELFAYRTILVMLQAQLEALEGNEALKKYGLDFDVEKEIMVESVPIEMKS